MKILIDEEKLNLLLETKKDFIGKKLYGLAFFLHVLFVSVF